MDNTAAALKVVKAYMTAMHDWAVRYAKAEGFPLDHPQRSAIGLTQRLTRSEQMYDSGEHQKFERQRQRILRRYCTAIERSSRGDSPGFPNHHPEREVVTKVRAVSEGRILVWTDYTREDGFKMRRKYELTHAKKRWRIEQHYLLDGKEYPEIY